MELLWLFVGILFGIYIGWTSHERAVRLRVTHLVNQFEETLNESTIKIKLERHNDMMYAYELDTNHFMAQGSNAKELEDTLRSKYPGKMFAASTKDIEESGLRK